MFLGKARPHGGKTRRSSEGQFALCTIASIVFHNREPRGAGVVIAEPRDKLVNHISADPCMLVRGAALSSPALRNDMTPGAPTR